MKKVIATLILASTVVSANAWGDREQGALAGLIVGIGAAAIANNNHNGNSGVNSGVIVQPAPVYRQAPVIIESQPRICGYNTWCPSVPRPVCYNQQIVDQWGRVVGYQQVCQ
jgi:hypothetical protein